LSTSGSTGSPKLVRLSHRNLAANAESIADYLQIRATDRAATTLPMGYSYGLSVINSHLANGAGLVLTELSVVDECFWTLFTRAEATTFAGVPYTFDLLERAGFADLDLPRLRYITAAGGRLAPHRVRTLAELGQRTGWDLFVMYGQTEATARMAYLPPDLAAAQPASIGIAIPGGALDLAPVDGEPSGDVGELVYTGANVMLGYAQEPADLALGRTTSVLRTGDLARVTDTGMYEIVGRRGGFAKLFGKRIDLQEVERSLGAHGINATCLALIPQSDSSADSERLVVAVVRADDCWPGSDRIRAAAAEAAAVAPTAIQVLDLPELPRLSSGKVDLPALRKLATQPNPRGAAEGDTSDVAEGDLVTSLVSAYAATLNRDDASVASSFVSLRGDSMSYVELSVVVERLLGKLPANWHVMSIGALANTVTTQSGGSQPPPHRNRWTRQIETNVLLRALAVFLVVGSHVTLFDLRGGAHLLIAIAGFNFARFHLSNSERRTRLRGMLASVRRIAVPSMVWMAFAALLDSQYSFANVFFLHNVVMPDADNAAWRYWFVEALVYLLIFSAAVVAIPALHRAEQRWPFGFVLVLLGVGLVFRYGLIETATGPKAIYTPAMVLFVFALGWAIARARTWPQRGLVVALIVVTLPGYSENLTRVVIVMAGLALLLLVPTVRVPSLLGKGVGLVAGASLYIYLSHWQVYPLFGEQELLALAASVGFGIALWFTVGRLTARTSSAASQGFAPWWKTVRCLRIRPTLRSGDSCVSKPLSLQPNTRSWFVGGRTRRGCS
ncbi:MAG: AMP-binding protein, partial [Candidatus Nanopelagicales bacterium]